MSKMVTAVHTHSQVVLVERGVLDALYWMDWHHSSGQLWPQNRLAFDRFLLTRSRTVDMVLLMTVSPAEAIRRDSEGGRDQSARMIVRPDVPSDFKHSIESVRRRYARRFEVVHLDTTELDREATLNRVVEEVGSVSFADRGGSLLITPEPSALHPTLDVQRSAPHTAELSGVTFRLWTVRCTAGLGGGQHRDCARTALPDE